MDRSLNEQVESFHSDESGFGMIEALASLFMIAVVSAALVSGLQVALRTAKFTEVHHAASSLAASKIELLAAKDVANLTSGDGGTEASVTWPGFNNLTFTRTTTVTVNADSSRTIQVSVVPNDSNLTMNVQFDTTFSIVTG